MEQSCESKLEYWRFKEGRHVKKCYCSFVVLLPLSETKLLVVDVRNLSCYSRGVMAQRT